MTDRRRHRLSEEEAMERGVRCPDCGSYTSFMDIIATGRCRGDCETRLSLDLVVERSSESIDPEAEG
jgi:hypothetical protein